MKDIQHQHVQKEWFVPNWKLKVLILGTFNPKGGQPVPYFYGRERNHMWKIISHCIGKDLHPNQGEEFFNSIQSMGIGCMDLLRSIKVPVEEAGKIQGKGYADSNLFKGTNQRAYMTDEILSVIDRNPGVCVLPTWGKGSSFRKITKEELVKIQTAQTFFLQSPNKTHKDKSRYSRKKKHKNRDF